MATAIKTKTTKVAPKSYRDYIKDSLTSNPTFSNYDHALHAWNAIKADYAEDDVIPSLIGAVVPMVRNQMAQPVVAAVFQERKDIQTQQTKAAKSKKAGKPAGTMVKQQSPYGHLAHIEFHWVDDNNVAHRANYLKATPEQHQARIDFLNKDVAGLKKTIAGHQQAIDDMNAEGVRSLAAVQKKRPNYEVPAI